MNLLTLINKATKYEADNCYKLSIFNLNKKKKIQNGKSDVVNWTSLMGNKFHIGYYVISTDSKKYIQLFYSTRNDNNELLDICYKVPLTTSGCNYGGNRAWFVCTASIDGICCGRRVGVLYKPWFGIYFACRHCYNLTYESSKLSGYQKKFGKPVTFLELQQLSNNLKRKYYQGKPTKRYKIYLKKENQLKSYMEAWENNFNKRFFKGA